MPPAVLVRTDASTAIGSGHALRTLALAQACREQNLSVTLASVEMPVSLRGRWIEEGASHVCVPHEIGSREDAAATTRLARELDSSWIVLDGYSFDTEYQSRLQAGGSRILLLDDLGGAPGYPVDSILNQNPYASADLYSAAASTMPLLLGSRYALLRSEFRNGPAAARSILPAASKLLVTFGGSDPAHGSELVLDALARVTDRQFEVRILVGASCSETEQIAAKAAGLPMKVDVIRDGARPSDLMRWCDFAICAAGSTSWELAFLGVPFLAVSVAYNQERVARSLAEQNVAIDLGPIASLSRETFAAAIETIRSSPDRRAAMSHAGRQLIDGQGVGRVMQALSLTSLRLDPARTDDADLLWQWANDADVRQSSFHSEPILWQEHERWFRQKLADPSALWVARDPQDRAIGLIRFGFDEQGDMQIGVSVAALHRGKGYGRKLIELGLHKARHIFSPIAAYAFIKIENVASIRAFASAGFRPAGEVIVRGCNALRYVYAY